MTVRINNRVQHLQVNIVGQCHQGEVRNIGKIYSDCLFIYFNIGSQIHKISVIFINM